MHKPVWKPLPVILLAPHAPATIGGVEPRAVCALLTPRYAKRSGNLGFKRQVHTWGVLSKLRYWSECRFHPLLRVFKQRRDLLCWRLREIAWHRGN